MIQVLFIALAYWRAMWTRDFCQSVRPSVRPSVCLSVRPSVCLSVQFR